MTTLGSEANYPARICPDGARSTGHAMPIPRPESDDYPRVQAGTVSQYVSDRIQAGDIDLYSAFQLEHEATRIHRLSYRQPAWGWTVGIRDLQKIFMLGLTARGLGCDRQAEIAETWFMDDSALLDEKREHHFIDRLADGRSLFTDRRLLEQLAVIRRDYDRLSDGDGPYHVEVFPYDFAEPENDILNAGSRREFKHSGVMDSEVEEVLVELLTGKWA